ncbi:DUF4913 domain-containing protein [Streptomyces sp. NPDC058287]|uniref:DUF4913 domain-containing protein n=1 Tax=unclassified Streptomyces TaxID=2593676 RepID=UPI0036F09773
MRCSSWFRHAQALSRPDSLWRAWETLRWDGALGMSNWWLHHVDPHLSALLDPVTGAFAGCGDGHRTSDPADRGGAGRAVRSARDTVGAGPVLPGLTGPVSVPPRPPPARQRSRRTP